MMETLCSIIDRLTSLCRAIRVGRAAEGGIDYFCGKTSRKAAGGVRSQTHQNWQSDP